MDKYRVTLTAEEQVALEHMVSTGEAAARKLTHARILLLANTRGENGSDEDIVAALGTSPRTIARVRCDLVTQGLEIALNRKSQPPRPDKIKISDPPRGVATGPCRCWPTNWWCWACSRPSASRRFDKH
jgi:hypothetical protein